MHTRNLVSTIALVAALSFSGGATAQTMIGGVDIPPEDLDRVQAYCNTLLAQANESLTANGGDDGDDDDNGDGTEPSDLDQAVTTIDLDIITLEDCKAAGLADTERVVVE